MENRLSKRLKLDFPKFDVLYVNTTYPFVYKILDKDGRMVSVFNARILDSDISIDNIIVCKDYRNQGIFKKINSIFESMFNEIRYSQVINQNLAEYLSNNGFIKKSNTCNDVSVVDFVKIKKK